MIVTNTGPKRWSKGFSTKKGKILAISILFTIFTTICKHNTDAYVPTDCDRKSFEFPPVLPAFVGYYGRPVPPREGWKNGDLHNKNGIDIAVEPGTPVLAAAPGKVTFSGWSDGYGITVIISHPNGTETLYAHMMKKLYVVENQIVCRGQVIGLSSNSGNVTSDNGGIGAHLHFEVHGAMNPLSDQYKEYIKHPHLF